MKEEEGKRRRLLPTTIIDERQARSPHPPSLPPSLFEMSSLVQTSFPSLTTLPTELSLATAKYLESASLKSLALVCRKTHADAISVLFAKVILSADPRSVRAFRAISESELVGLVK